MTQTFQKNHLENKQNLKKSRLDLIIFKEKPFVQQTNWFKGSRSRGIH